jgi:glycerophosphoryl diester phosphodiesterase
VLINNVENTTLYATNSSSSIDTNQTIDDEIMVFPSSTQSTDDNSDVAIIAHRGYSEVAPENTIPAFIAAAENGYNTIEFDVSWTKDSVPVILHDQTINRTARTQTGWQYIFPRYCSNYNYDELLELDFGSWKGTEFKGTKIPSFTETLECAKDYDLNMYVELKQNSDFDDEKAQILVDAVKEAGLEDKVTWISFNEDYLQKINDLMPNCRIGLLSKKTPTETIVNSLDNLNTDSNEVFLDVKGSKMTETSSNILHDAGFDFEAWTIDNSSILGDLYSFDCKGITTNKLTQQDISDFLSAVNE